MDREVISRHNTNLFFLFFLLLFQIRFANYPNILAWEIMNEPEWVVSDLPQDVLDTTTVDPISRAAFWDFCSSVINLVHATTDHQVTIGTYRAGTGGDEGEVGESREKEQILK